MDLIGYKKSHQISERRLTMAEYAAGLRLYLQRGGRMRGKGIAPGDKVGRVPNSFECQLSEPVKGTLNKNSGQ